MSTALTVRRHLNYTCGMVPWGGGLLALLTVLFVVIRIGEATGSAPAWVRGYGDDLLCLPLVLSLALTARRLVGRSGSLVLPVSHGLMAVAFFAVLFEVILPVTRAAAVADPRDVFMYVAGFMFFQMYLNRCGSGVSDRHSRKDIFPHHPSV